MCSLSSQFNDACLQGNLAEVKRMISFHHLTVLNITWSIGTACRVGHGDIVEVLSSLPYIEWNYALSQACAGGHMDMIRLTIAKGANNWNRGLIHAARAGQMESIKFMLEKGADDVYEALTQASYTGHMDVVKFLINKGATNHGSAFLEACLGGHIDIVKLMLDLGCTYVQLGISYAFKKQHMNIVIMLTKILGFISDEIDGLTDDDINYLYKSRVSCSNRYRERYSALREEEKLLITLLPEIFIPEIANIIYWY